MNNKKKGLVLSILGILSLVLITVGVTYAFFNYAKEGTTENAITTSSITFIYTEIDQVGKGISISEIYPTSDEVGKNQIGSGKVFNFKIKSTTPKSNISYEVTARKSTDSDLDEQAVRMYLTEVIGETEKEILLDNYSNLIQTNKVEIDKYAEKILYKGTVYANDNYEKNFRLRMWLDENVDFSPVKDESGNDTYPYNDKKFTVIVNVYANANVVTDEEVSLESNAEVEAVTADGVIFEEAEETEDYDFEVTLPNGTSNTSIEVIPESENATVEVEKIDSLVYNSSKIKRLTAIDVFDLVTGDNYFKVTITSENKKNINEFKINVKVEQESINTLESIKVTGYKITPAFDKEITSYETTTEASEIEVITEKTSELSSVSITGNENLSWGENTVSIIVTAENGEIKTYKIKVNNNKPVAPTITGGSANWLTAAPTINISTAGNATSGVKHYEYYKSTSNTQPTDTTTATGTTTGSLTVSDEGIRYVWYRTVSNNGYKSAWSNMQTVKLDTQNPTIKVSVSGKVATLTLGDNLGIVGYGVNQSTGTQPGYTAASGTSAQKTWTASAAGSYVAWVKDQAGRTATASFSIASTAFCAYSAGQVVKTFDYNGGIQSLKIPCNGTYKLEVWGAQGGNSAHGGTGGKGGYSYGNKTLTTSNTLYIGVGGQGTYYGESYHPTTGDTNGGYNGGGALVNTYWFSYTTTGGGATHIALNTNRGELKNYASYKSEVLIVAGGGGAGSFEEEDDEEGVYYSYVGGAGGGASGGNGSGQTNQPGYGATQSAGGKGAHGAGSSDGKFGYAGPAYGGANTATGGGGWYGGGTSGSNASAGGGSGYIGGVTGGVTTAGQRSGHGYARITLVSLSQ